MLIFNVAMNTTDKPHRGHKVARYTSTNLMLIRVMEKGDSRLNFARSWTSLHLLVRMAYGTIYLDGDRDEDFYLSATARGHPQTSSDWTDQTGHNDF